MNWSDDVDPDAHTQLDFEPLDPEPTGRAEGLAWSTAEGQVEEDYPYSPDSAPTEVQHPHSATPLVLGAVVLAVAAIICATVLAVLTLTKPSSSPVAAPTMTASASPAPTSPATTMAPPPPPVTTVTPSPTKTVASGPTIGDDCSDWMKFAVDPVSGQEMLCSGYSDNIGHGASPQWYSAEKGAVGPSDGAADLPRVGKKGSSCRGEVAQTMGRSSDGYFVWCIGGGQYDPPGSQPIWTVYSP